MPEGVTRDWPIFREAFQRGLPNAELWDRLEQADAWTLLPLPQALDALRGVRTYSNRDWFTAIQLVYFKWYRKTGYGSDLAGQQQVQTLWQTIAAGGGTEQERIVGSRLYISFTLLSDLLQRDPSARVPLSPEEQARAARKAETQRASSQLLDRLLSSPAGLAGLVTPESIENLRQIRSAFAALREITAEDDGGLPDVYYGAAETAFALARSCSILHRYEEALENFREAADFFERGGLAEKASDVRAFAQGLMRQLHGEFDAEAASRLGSLNEIESKQSNQSVLRRIATLFELSRIASGAFDSYEALKQAELAATELKNLGLVDPSGVGVEAVERWIEVATQRFGRTGNLLLGLLMQIGNWYRILFSARHAELIRSDSAAAEALLAAQSRMDAELESVFKIAAEVESQREELMREFAPSEKEAQPKSSNKKRDDLGDVSLIDRMRKIDTTLASIVERCNARVWPKDGMDDLLAELDVLTPEADSLNMPVYAAKVRLERAYILRALERASDLREVAREAREKLLCGRIPSLTSFTESSDRILFLDTYRREMEAALIQGAFEQLADVCDHVIQDFESIRSNVQDPYRAASLLRIVSEFYDRAIFAAYKLSRWDDLLETTELIKARSALRQRVAAASNSAQAETVAKLAAEFDRLSDARLIDPEAAQKRRQLWDLLSVLRSKEKAAALPEFSLHALQAAVREDEALVGFFWLAGSVFLTICIDRTRCVVERVVLTQEQVGEWQVLFKFICELKSTAGRNFERAVESAGRIFLTPQIREFVREKERLILSAHRGLHVFPFHAVRWDEKDFIGSRFAVKYVPNFSSVMLPWIRRYESRFFGLAVEQFADSQIPPLANVETDLAEIAREYENGGNSIKLLVATAAARSHFTGWRDRSELTRARCVHFGTHGISVLKSPNEPMDARILLQDGPLDCMDIAQLSLSADVVVLGACDSGRQSMEFRQVATGDDGVPGDEIFGLQSAFFQAGARCVLGSLWLVETESSSKLIRLFHREYAHLADPEIAWRNAVRTYLADPTANHGTFYWAPYFLLCLGGPSAG